MANRSLELIYSKTPVFIQNIAVTIKGLLLKKIRKGGKYNSYKQSVHSRQSWSTTKFEQYQLEQFRELVNYAKLHVPYYCKLLTKLDIPSTLKETSLQSIPILHRNTLKMHPADFISDAISAEKSLSLHTTGTTGSPLTIQADADARQKNYAFFDAYLESLGLNPNSKHIILGGRIIVPQNVKKPPFWRYSFFQKSLLMSSYHLLDEHMDAYIDKIESFSPEYIESYPSSIYTLCKYVLKKGRRLNCKAVITSAETLFPEQREVIEQALNTTVYDQYGCAEMAFFVAQCSMGNYHVRSDYGILELVDDDGNSVKKGKPGHVVCTGFINKSMPLIRYSIGDIATFSEAITCKCGLSTPIIKEIQGRKDDALITSNGNSVGRMSPVLKGFAVLESQYIQYKAGEVELLIVPDADFSSKRDIHRIIESVQMRLGNDCKVNIQLVNKIKRGKSGKLKTVISYVDQKT